MTMTAAIDIAIPRIIDLSRRVNRKVFTIDRCVILLLLNCCKDGLQYREIKNMLPMSDGKLIADLTTLVNGRLLNKSSHQWDNKVLDVYTISDDGVSEMQQWREFFHACEKMLEMCK